VFSAVWFFVDIFLEVEAEYFLNRDSYYPVYISKAYIVRNGIVTPVWVFAETTDFLNKVMIDVLSGEIVHIG